MSARAHRDTPASAIFISHIEMMLLPWWAWALIVLVILGVAVGMWMWVSQMISSNGPKGVVPVPIVLDEYAGKWYEVARLENWFETGCTAVTAEYAANADGSVAVTNTCFKSGGVGEPNVANGRAVLNANGTLSVAFPAAFPISYGNYTCVYRADDAAGRWQTSAVVNSDLAMAWILDRRAQVPVADFDAARAALAAAGVNVDKLVHIIQPFRAER